MWASSIITLPRYFGLYRIIVSEFNHHFPTLLFFVSYYCERVQSYFPTLLWFVSYYCERVQSSLSHAIMVCIVLLWASSIITFPRYYGLYRIIVSEFNHHSPTLLWFVSYYCERVQSLVAYYVTVLSPGLHGLYLYYIPMIIYILYYLVFK